MVRIVRLSPAGSHDVLGLQVQRLGRGEIVRQIRLAPVRIDRRPSSTCYEMIDPVITLDEDAKWEKIWTELFLKGQKPKKESD